MEDYISSDTSGQYKKLLISLTTANRPETNEVEMNKVEKDVDDLITAGIKKLGTDESKFNSVFGIRSFAHLRAMFEEYKRKSGEDIENSIKAEMSGNLAKTYLALSKKN
jgi:annexin A7/11